MIFSQSKEWDIYLNELDNSNNIYIYLKKSENSITEIFLGSIISDFVDEVNLDINFEEINGIFMGVSIAVDYSDGDEATMLILLEPGEAKRLENTLQSSDGWSFEEGYWSDGLSEENYLRFDKKKNLIVVKSSVEKKVKDEASSIFRDFSGYFDKSAGELFLAMAVEEDEMLFSMAFSGHGDGRILFEATMPSDVFAARNSAELELIKKGEITPEIARKLFDLPENEDIELIDINFKDDETLYFSLVIASEKVMEDLMNAF